MGAILKRLNFRLKKKNGSVKGAKRPPPPPPPHPATLKEMFLPLSEKLSDLIRNTIFGWRKQGCLQI